jgi:hypothetical protein
VNQDPKKSFTSHMKDQHLQLGSPPRVRKKNSSTSVKVNEEYLNTIIENKEDERSRAMIIEQIDNSIFSNSMIRSAYEEGGTIQTQTEQLQKAYR